MFRTYPGGIPGGYDDWKLSTPPEYDELPYGPQEGEEIEEHEDQDPSDGYPNPDVDPQLHG